MLMFLHLLVKDAFGSLWGRGVSSAVDLWGLFGRDVMSNFTSVNSSDDAFEHGFVGELV